MHNRLLEYKSKFHRVRCEVTGKSAFMNGSISSSADHLILFCECCVKFRQRGWHVGCHRGIFRQSCDDILILPEVRYASKQVCPQTLNGQYDFVLSLGVAECVRPCLSQLVSK